jgi:RNase adaptor protein for sRNA GlmZ degradation
MASMGYYNEDGQIKGTGYKRFNGSVNGTYKIFPFLNAAYSLVDASVKRYMERGFSNLSVCFGCTGGQHRSVYSAQHMAEHINKKFGVKVELIHREQNIEQTFERTL